MPTRDLEVTRRLRLDRLDLTAGEHLLVSGGNGAGKSTLLGVLAGRLAADGGEVRVTARRVAELAQDVSFADPRRAAEAVYGDLGPASAPALRGLGLLHARDLRTPVERAGASTGRGQQRFRAVTASPSPSSCHVVSHATGIA